MQLLIEKIHEDSVLPKYGYSGDAGMDLFAYNDYLIKPGERISIATGIKMAIPEGYTGLVWDKSGMSFKRGLKTMGGVVDSGYRGEIMVCLVNLSSEDQEIKKGEKVAQMIIQPFISAEINESESGKLEQNTARGINGFGSTGK